MSTRARQGFPEMRSPPNEISLKRRILNAGIWSLSGFVLSLVIRLGSNLLMTRLLVPEMFGVVAIASTVIVGLAMFSDVGVKQNIVQSKHGSEPNFLNTAWTIQILRGGMIFCLALFVCALIFLAGRLGLFSKYSVYAEPSLPYVAALLSISALIAGFESTKLYQASREIQLGRLTCLEFITQIIGLAVMLAWVYFDRSILALVAGSLTSSLSRMILSHAMLFGVPNRWHWDREAAYEIIHFGKWILASSILGFFVNSGDRLLLGGLVDAPTLGYYAIASLFIGALEGVINRVISDVSFPAFSEVVRTKAKNLKASYYKVYGVIAIFCYLLSGTLMTFAITLINVLYDQRYLPAGWILSLLAATLLTFPLRLAVQCFLALGMPKLQSHVIVVRVLALFILTPVSFHFFGMTAALMAIVASHFVALPVIVLYNLRYQLFDLERELRLLIFFPIGLGVGKAAALAVAWWK